MFVPHSASWFNICFVLIAHFRELLLNRMNFEDDHDPRLLWASWRARRFQWASSSRVCAICQLQNAIFNSHKFFFRVAQARWRQNWLENMWRKKKVTFTWNAPTHTAMHGTMLAFHVAPHRCVYGWSQWLWRNVMSRKNWNFNWILKQIFLLYFSRVSRSKKIFQLLTIVLLLTVLVSVVSDAWQQWQQPADGAEIQLLPHGGGEAGVVRMPSADSHSDECDGRHSATDARSSTGRCLREHTTQHGAGSSEPEE